MVFDHAFAGRDPGQLMRRRCQRQLDLQGGIFAQAAERRCVAHLVAQAGEAAELVEHAALAAPEEHVGVGRQFVAVRAELQPLLRAMVGEVARRRCRPAACGRTTARGRRASRRAVRRRCSWRRAASPRRAQPRRCRGRCRMPAPTPDSRHAERGGGEQRQDDGEGRAVGRAANAISAISALRSKRRSASSAKTRRCTASTARPAKMSVSRMLASHGRVVSDRAAPP